MVHGAAVTEAVVRSAAVGQDVEKSRRRQTRAFNGSRKWPRAPHVLHAGAPDRQLGSALEERQHLSARGEGARRAGPEVRCLPAHLGAVGRAALARTRRKRRRPQEVLRRQRPLSLHGQRVRLRRLQEAGDQGRRLRAGLADAGAPRVHEAGGQPARGARARRHQPVDPERAARLQAEGHRRRTSSRPTPPTSSTSSRISSS